MRGVIFRGGVVRGGSVGGVHVDNGPAETGGSTGGTVGAAAGKAAEAVGRAEAEADDPTERVDDLESPPPVKRFNDGLRGALDADIAELPLPLTPCPRRLKTG